MREQLWKFFLTFPVLERDELVYARGNYRVVEKKDVLFASLMNDVQHNFVYNQQICVEMDLGKARY